MAQQWPQFPDVGVRDEKADPHTTAYYPGDRSFPFNEIAYSDFATRY